MAAIEGDAGLYKERRGCARRQRVEWSAMAPWVEGKGRMGRLEVGIHRRHTMFRLTSCCPADWLLQPSTQLEGTCAEIVSTLKAPASDQVQHHKHQNQNQIQTPIYALLASTSILPPPCRVTRAPLLACLLDICYRSHSPFAGLPITIANWPAEC